MTARATPQRQPVGVAAYVLLFILSMVFPPLSIVGGILAGERGHKMHDRSGTLMSAAIVLLALVALSLWIAGPVGGASVSLAIYTAFVLLAVLVGLALIIFFTRRRPPA